MNTDAQHPQPERTRWFSWIPWALALTGLAYLAGLTLWLGLAGLFFPYQLDYGEGTMLHFVQELSKGHAIYRTPGGYPHITANYAPLTLLLGLALTPVLGMTYTAGRVWTLLAIAAIAFLLVVWVRREGRRWLPALAAGLLFVGSPYVYHWAPLYRVDLIGLALTLGGLYAVYLASPQPSRRPTGPPSRPPIGGPTLKKGYLWLAAILFVAALFTKQSFVFAPAATLFYLFFFVDRRQAIKMGAIMIVLGGGLFLLINTLTAGGFWYGLVVSNVNPYLWPEFWAQQASFFGTFAILCLLAAWYVVDKFVLDRATPLREKVSPLDIYLPAALSSVLLAGKAGAWENYFFEALAALALCAGLGLARLGRHGKLPYHLLAPLLILVQVAVMWHTPRIANRYLGLTRQSNQDIAPILANTPDPIISEDLGLLVTNDKVLDYWSFQNSQLARAGRWDQSWEMDQLRNRRLSMVILERGTRLDVDYYQRFTREFLSELDRNYCHSQTIGKYEIYEPDPLQHEARIDFGDELALLGWSLDVSEQIEPGDTLSLTTVWQAQQAIENDYTAFAHLVDQVGQGWAGDDHQPYEGLYSTSAWGAGEMVRDTFTLTVPTNAPPGLYDLQVGWYDPATGDRLAQGTENAFRVAVLPVQWAGTGGQALTPLEARFGQAITLEGYHWQADSEGIRLTLRWSAGGYPATDYVVFVHLVDPADGDRTLAQGDASPLDGRWPTSLWLPGIELDDVHTIPLPGNLSQGDYDLLVGLYDPVTGDRLPLAGGSETLRLPGISLP